MDWNQADRLYSLLKNDNEVFSRNKKLLLMAKLLLDEVDFKNETMSHFSEDKITEIFVGFVKLAEGCEAFYRESADLLNPHLKAGAFGQKLDNLLGQISEVSGEFRKMEETSRELLAREQEFNKIKTEYDELVKKRNDLQELQEIVKPENMKKYIQEIAGLEAKLKDDRTKYEEIQLDRQKLLGALETTSSVIKEIEDLNEGSVKQVLQVIKGLDADVRARIDLHRRELSQLEADINSNLEEYKQLMYEIDNFNTQLEEIRKIYWHNHNLYEKHFIQNENIWFNTRNHGSGDISAIKSEMEECSQLIETNLTRMDQLLKNCIIAGEKIKNNIRKMNQIEYDN